MEFELAKGVAEKVFAERFPIVMRTIIPGMFAGIVLYNAVQWLLNVALGKLLQDSWEKLAVVVGALFLLGALLSSITGEIYKIYEGRIWWPGRLKRRAIRRHARRVVRLMRQAEAIRQKDPPRYNELWYRLRDYPLDENTDPTATHPTLVGNILAAYEEYPFKRYRMDAVFYWPRLWLQVEKDTKEQIESEWSVADGFMLLSAIAYGGGILWLIEALVVATDFADFHLPLGSPGLAFLGGLGLLVLGFVFYRFSIPFHRANGELFKSIYDVYRKKLAETFAITINDPGEKDRWYEKWSYLQYLRIRCPNCKKITVATLPTCQKCGNKL